MPLINTLWSPYLPLEVEWQGDGDDCREVWKSVCCLCSVVCLKSTRIPASLPIFVQWYVVRPYYVLWYLFYGLILTCKWVNTLKGSFAESKLRDCGLNSLIIPPTHTFTTIMNVHQTCTIDEPTWAMAAGAEPRDGHSHISGTFRYLVIFLWFSATSFACSLTAYFKNKCTLYRK